MKNFPTFFIITARRLACIVFCIIVQTVLSSAKTKITTIILYSDKLESGLHHKATGTDTILRNSRKQEREEKNKIKELAKARKQPKPEKIESGDNGGAEQPRQKPKRQRRPQGLERPPEIPRRNGN